MTFKFFLIFEYGHFIIMIIFAKVESVISYSKDIYLF